jgi:hypothetical protein
MGRIQQSNSDLMGHLVEQFGFLIRSAQVYDNGIEDEAKRLASTLRILLHDTPKQKSLLASLNKKILDFTIRVFHFVLVTC